MAEAPPAGFTPLDDPGPLLETVGPVLAHADGRLGLRAERRHLNWAGTVHGGLLATLADTALGRAIREDAEDHAVTVSLTTDYLGPAKEGDWIELRAEVERVGGRLAFGDCAVTVDGKEVVRARAVFAVLRD
jgi:acyl-coenzyme A thioesterase 13